MIGQRRKNSIISFFIGGSSLSSDVEEAQAAADARTPAQPQLPWLSVEEELLRTEQAYVKRLEVLVDVFKGPLAAWAAEIPEDQESLASHVSAAAVRTIFSNVEEVLRVSRFMLEAFQQTCCRSTSLPPSSQPATSTAAAAAKVKAAAAAGIRGASKDSAPPVPPRSGAKPVAPSAAAAAKTAVDSGAAAGATSPPTGSDWSLKSVADVFVELSPFLMQYLMFFATYDEASELLERLLENCAEFRLFVRACELQPSCKGERISSLLIQPIQRLPRYRLLLETMLKMMPETFPGRPRMEEAVQRVSGVLQRLNEEIAKQQNRAQVVEIQQQVMDESIARAFLAPHRRLLRQGSLLKLSQVWGVSQQRFLLLFNDVLIYGKQLFGKLLGFREIQLDRCVIIDIDGPAAVEASRRVTSGAAGTAFVGPAAAAAAADDDSEIDERNFIVLAPNRPVQFQAASVAEKQQWLEAFRVAFRDINQREQVQQLGFVYESDGRAHFPASASSASQRSAPMPDKVRSLLWIPRKISANVSADDGAVSSMSLALPDEVFHSTRGVFLMSSMLKLQSSVSGLSQVARGLRGTASPGAAAPSPAPTPAPAPAPAPAPPSSPAASSSTALSPAAPPAVLLGATPAAAGAAAGAPHPAASPSVPSVASVAAPAAGAKSTAAPPPEISRVMSQLAKPSMSSPYMSTPPPPPMSPSLAKPVEGSVVNGRKVPPPPPR